MRIAFVSGCLEPGADGVGDYTRLLAAACVRRGHAVRLLSVGERKTMREDGVAAVWRLAADEWRRDGVAAARRWLEEFSPDWTSLQFVPYSFDPRGFFGQSVAALANVLDEARKRHIFMHEIWIGSHAGAPWTARLAGGWQRRATRRLFASVRPDMVHTSTRYHVEALAVAGQAARLLPLFGNVPVCPGVMAAEIPDVASDAIVCGMFGTLHESWRHDEFLGEFAALARRRGRPAAFVATGKMGAGGRERFAQIAARWSDAIQCRALGELPAGELARVFARFNFGVTPVPWNIVGKSGSVAALREHGRRVVVTVAGPRLRGSVESGGETAETEGFVPFFRDPGLLATALEPCAPGPGVEVVAERFLADLNAGNG